MANYGALPGLLQGYFATQEYYAKQKRQVEEDKYVRAQRAREEQKFAQTENERQALADLARQSIGPDGQIDYPKYIQGLALRGHGKVALDLADKWSDNQFKEHQLFEQSQLRQNEQEQRQREAVARERNWQRDDAAKAQRTIADLAFGASTQPTPEGQQAAYEMAADQARLQQEGVPPRLEADTIGTLARTSQLFGRGGAAKAPLPGPLKRKLDELEAEGAITPQQRADTALILAKIIEVDDVGPLNLLTETQTRGLGPQGPMQVQPIPPEEAVARAYEAAPEVPGGKPLPALPQSAKPAERLERVGQATKELLDQAGKAVDPSYNDPSNPDFQARVRYGQVIAPSVGGRTNIRPDPKGFERFQADLEQFSRALDQSNLPKTDERIKEFQKELGKYVDTSGPVWELRSSEGVPGVGGLGGLVTEYAPILSNEEAREMRRVLQPLLNLEIKDLSGATVTGQEQLRLMVANATKFGFSDRNFIKAMQDFVSAYSTTKNNILASVPLPILEEHKRRGGSMEFDRLNQRTVDVMSNPNVRSRIDAMAAEIISTLEDQHPGKKVDAKFSTKDGHWYYFVTDPKTNAPITQGRID